MESTKRTGFSFKPVEELTFTDNFMFEAVMRSSPEICAGVIERLLKIKVDRIEYPEVEGRKISRGLVRCYAAHVPLCKRLIPESVLNRRKLSFLIG